jgi:hypothetical protein
MSRFRWNDEIWVVKFPKAKADILGLLKEGLRDAENVMLDVPSYMENQDVLDEVEKSIIHVPVKSVGIFKGGDIVKIVKNAKPKEKVTQDMSVTELLRYAEGKTTEEIASDTSLSEGQKEVIHTMLFDNDGNTGWTVIEM